MKGSTNVLLSFWVPFYPTLVGKIGEKKRERLHPRCVCDTPSRDEACVLKRELLYHRARECVSLDAGGGGVGGKPTKPGAGGKSIRGSKRPAVAARKAKAKAAAAGGKGHKGK